MDNLKIGEQLENLGLSSQQVDDVLDLIRTPDQGEKIQQFDETEIKYRMMIESDWRKRAALAALLISKSL